MLLGFGWFLHSSSSYWLLWAGTQQNPGVWLYLDPEHKLLSFRVIWWVRLCGGVAESTLISMHGCSQHHVTYHNQRCKGRLSQEGWISLSGFLAMPPPTPFSDGTKG